MFAEACLPQGCVKLAPELIMVDVVDVRGLLADEGMTFANDKPTEPLEVAK